MLETAVAQLRFALSLALGRPFHTPSLDHLIDAIRETQHEFGPMAIGAEEAEILGGPALDEATRRDMQLRRFRGQAKRGARETALLPAAFRRPRPGPWPPACGRHRPYSAHPQSRAAR